MNPSTSGSSNMTQMADIFLPVLPESVVPSGLMIIETVSVLMLIVLLIFFLWKWFNNPYEKLKRHLKNNTLSSREALHHLSSLLLNRVELNRVLLKKAKMKQNKDFDKNSKNINQLRFQKQLPDIDAVIILIDKMKRDD